MSNLEGADLHKMTPEESIDMDNMLLRHKIVLPRLIVSNVLPQNDTENFQRTAYCQYPNEVRYRSSSEEDDIPDLVVNNK